jgi:hypothetical protein
MTIDDSCKTILMCKLYLCLDCGLGQESSVTLSTSIYLKTENSIMQVLQETQCQCQELLGHWSSKMQINRSLKYLSLVIYQKCIDLFIKHKPFFPRNMFVWISLLPLDVMLKWYECAITWVDYAKWLKNCLSVVYAEKLIIEVVQLC